MPFSVIDPTVGGDVGSWGTKLNTALDAIVAQINTNIASDAAKLPLAGGALTGRLDAKTSTMAVATLGASSGAIALDLVVAQYFIGTITGATTFSFSNVPAVGAQGVILRLTNPGAGAITWPTGTKWPGGSAPAFTVAGIDVVVLISDDAGTTWRANVAMKDVR